MPELELLDPKEVERIEAMRKRLQELIEATDNLLSDASDTKELAPNFASVLRTAVYIGESEYADATGVWTCGHEPSLARAKGGAYCACCAFLQGERNRGEAVKRRL